MSEQPRHTEGQGEVCDPTCPHWGWAASRSVASATGGEPTTEATAPTTEAGKALEREIGGDYGPEIAAIEAEARSSAAEASAGAGPRLDIPYHDDCSSTEARLNRAERLLRDVMEHPTHNLDESLMNDIDDWLHPPFRLASGAGRASDAPPRSDASGEGS